MDSIQVRCPTPCTTTDAIRQANFHVQHTIFGSTLENAIRDIHIQGYLTTDAKTVPKSEGIAKGMMVFRLEFPPARTDVRDETPHATVIISVEHVAEIEQDMLRKNIITRNTILCTQSYSWGKPFTYSYGEAQVVVVIDISTKVCLQEPVTKKGIG